jgi:hypothetical protein
MSYFANDCIPLACEARHSDKVFLEVATLVLLSIQQPWYGMPRQFADVRNNGRDSVYLFGAKRAGFDYVAEHARALRIDAQIAYDKKDLDALVMRFLDVPCLGLAKASFLAQMTMADGACLDVHNLRSLGLDATALRLSKTLTIASKARKVSTYNSAWQSKGDSAFWWDSWCEGLLTRSAYHRFANAAEVSAMHLLPLS